MEKETEQLLGQAQIYQQQIQTILAQKTALTLELNEVRKSLEEIEKSDEKSVFKLSGPIMIKVDKLGMKKELKERENTINMRLTTIERQELKIKEKIEELRSRLMKSRPEAG